MLYTAILYCRMMIEGLMRRWALTITTAITLTTGDMHGAVWSTIMTSAERATYEHMGGGE
jgi:hypothetical protein